MNDKVRVTQNQLIIAQKIISEIQEVFGKRNISLETTINHDLGVYGDDFDELLFLFDSICDINWEEFEFNRHMKGECNGPFILIELLLNLIRLIPYIIIKIWNKKRGENFWEATDILPSPNKGYEPLFVSDIIVSAITGKFQYASDSNFDFDDLREMLQL